MGSDASEEVDLSILDEPPVVDSLAPMDAALNLGTTLLNPIPTQEDHLFRRKP